MPTDPGSVFSVGVDLVDVGRIERLWRRRGSSFLERVFTPAEREYCLKRARPGESLAVRFAAKEAVMKCLRTGWTTGVGFRQIEVLPDAEGAPAVRLSGGAADAARRHGVSDIHVSLSHTSLQAVAFAVASR